MVDLAEKQVGLVPTGEGNGHEVLNVLTDKVTIKIRASETGGAFSLVELDVPPGGGTPPHIHNRETEVFYVLEGTATFWSESGEVQAQAGSTLYGPVGIPHCYRNDTDKPLKMLVTMQPAGMENMFVEFDEVSRETDLTIPQVIEICAKYGIDILPTA